MSNPIRYKDCSHVECFDLKSFFDVVFQFPYDKLECPICQKKFDFEVLLDESNSDPEPLSGKVYSPHFQIKYSIVNNAKSPSISWPFKPNNKTTADVINDMITRRFNYDIAIAKRLISLQMISLLKNVIFQNAQVHSASQTR